MIVVQVNGKKRIVRDNMISYHTENDLECKYKNHYINIAAQETGGFYCTVRDESGMYAVDGYFGGLYCRYEIETIEDCLRMCIENILL